MRERLPRILLGFPVLLAAIALFAVSTEVEARALTVVSDRIVTSAPNATSNHTIQFTVTSAIPVSGTIHITPLNGAFVIPSGFDYTDVDFAVSNGGPFVDRSLASAPSTSDDGISVVSGSSASLTITLNSSTNIEQGEIVKIELGTNATFGDTGDVSPTNPGSTGSYRILIETKDQSGTRIDSAQTMIAIVSPVTIGLQNPNVPPVRSSGLPSGTIAAGNANVEISFETNEYATCKYSTTAGVAYGLMAGTLYSADNYLFHTIVTGHQNDTTYTYYVRCADIYEVENTDDYEITFTVDENPASDTSTASGGSVGQGGVGAFSQGSSVLYLGSVKFSGWSAPQSTVSILKDGTLQGAIRTQKDGSFNITVSNLQRGVYSFLTYATDSQNRKSGTFSTTLFVAQGSNNVVSNVVMPPTIALEDDTAEVGEDVRVSGQGTPGSTIEVFLTPSGGTEGEPEKFTATSEKDLSTAAAGTWEVVIGSDKLSKGTYRVRARSILSSLAVSELSNTLSLGVGETPSSDLVSRADINGDDKTNLVDFSIMLSFWGTNDSAADINADGNINLADFSILLFNWTG